MKARTCALRVWCNTENLSALTCLPAEQAIPLPLSAFSTPPRQLFREVALALSRAPARAILRTQAQRAERSQMIARAQSHASSGNKLQIALPTRQHPPPIALQDTVHLRSGSRRASRASWPAAGATSPVIGASLESSTWLLLRNFHMGRVFAGVFFLQKKKQWSCESRGRQRLGVHECRRASLQRGETCAIRVGNNRCATFIAIPILCGIGWSPGVAWSDCVRLFSRECAMRWSGRAGD